MDPMGYLTLADCLADLGCHKELVTIESEIDPFLEAAAVQRRLYEVQGPAVLFHRVKGTSFPVVGNIFGTMARTRFIFRDTLDAVRALVAAKINPPAMLKNPWLARHLPGAALRLVPKRVRSGPILSHTTSLSKLPQKIFIGTSKNIRFGVFQSQTMPANDLN